MELWKVLSLMLYLGKAQLIYLMNKSCRMVHLSEAFMKMTSEIQLRLFPTLLHVKEKFNFRDVLESIRSMSSTMRTTITEVVKLIKLILLAPASNAEGERIFSGVRRVKTYLRSIVKQDRLNDPMMIHVHKDRID